MSREKTKAVLNQSVADLSKAAALVHQVHWYLRGPGFMKLHPKMDELMDSINDYLDVIAERLITLGGSPYSTLKEFSEHTKIEEKVGSYEESIEERYLQKELISEVNRIIETLPEKIRIPLTLFYLSNCSVEQISTIIKKPPGTVKSRLFKGRSLIKKRLEEAGYEK